MNLVNIRNGVASEEAEQSDDISDELVCLMKYENDTLNVEIQDHYCNPVWDGLTCWPYISNGTLATTPCFREFNGILYDFSANASRLCFSNGSWASRSDYSKCKPITEDESYFKVLWKIKEAITVYFTGYSFSLLAVMVAIYIFIRFRNLRCLRNNIHLNLLITYFLLDSTWIVTAVMQSVDDSEAPCYLTILLTYFLVTNFFWMFVEGLFLYILAVRTFSLEVLRMPFYVLIGWGIPVVIVTTWAGAKYYNVRLPTEFLSHSCPWQAKTDIDLIFILPVLMVLLVNIFFLIKVMIVLLFKKSITSTADSRQYRKAAKALMVLLPLLGITYMLILVTPPYETPSRVVIYYLQALLISTQGLAVAVLYCFLNREVQKSIHQSYFRWITSRKIRKTVMYSRARKPSGYDTEQGESFYRSVGIRPNRNFSMCISTTNTTNTTTVSAATADVQSNCTTCITHREYRNFLLRESKL